MCKREREGKENKGDIKGKGFFSKVFFFFFFFLKLIYRYDLLQETSNKLNKVGNG